MQMQPNAKKFIETSRPRAFLRKFLNCTSDRGGLGDGSPPAGSKGGAPVGGLGNEVPQKLKHIFVFYSKF